MPCRRLLLCFTVIVWAGLGLAQAADLPMRLGDAARPLAYRLALRVDPDQAAHSGQVVIDVQLSRSVQSLRLHARGVEIDAVSLAGVGGRAGSRAQKGRVERLDTDNVLLRFAASQPAGRAQLRLRFRGEVSEKEGFGLFRQREGGDWYAFTQFEDIGARRAFPLFDEPGWKVPWTLTLTVPTAQTAIANMPVRRQTPAGPGWKQLEFAPTPPMPAYLLAFAVGPFDLLDGGLAGHKTPLRFVTPKGRAQEATYAASVTPAIVERLQAYFGSPHPFAKLDSLAVPATEYFGAMENAGLITYVSSLLLARPDEESETFRRSYLDVAAHEISHQWFGNLVTMRWWDDLWLNESFASWIGTKITAEMRPEWHWENNNQQARSQAMRGDRLSSARRVRQPVLTPQDLGTAFDEITYAKGQSVLTMFESWLGPAHMQAGVRRYLKQHAWGSATGDDFLAALAREDAELAPAFASFIDQPGIPAVSVVLHCGADGPRLHLSQSRYRPLGIAPVTPSAEKPPLWQVPLQLRTPAGLTRVLLKTPEADVALPDRQCPAWLAPNVGGVGYYRAVLAPALLQAFVREGQPTTVELMALLDDQRGLAESGELPLADFVHLIGETVSASAPQADERRHLLVAAAAALGSIRPLLTADQLPGYARLWQQQFGAMARQWGWQLAASDSSDRRLLRQTLLPLVANLGQDPVLRSQARALVTAWLAAADGDGAAHPEALDPGLRRAVLQSAAAGGDAALFEALVSLARRTPIRRVRADLLETLAYFDAPELAERARGLLLDTAIDIREILPEVLAQQSRRPALAGDVLAFVAAHDAVLRERLGSQAPAYLPEQLGKGCGGDQAAALQQLFGPQAAAYEAGPGVLAKVTESLRLCGAYRDAQTDSLARLLAN